MLGFLVLP
uniref:Cycloamanide C n=1 Tax=Amanita phalloides TaxID=67723 RepID=CYAC_AMAPH|nr:RecName: Full=Cycloamanide C; Short=CyA C; Short=Cyl C [Amanita phalloides]